MIVREIVRKYTIVIAAAFMLAALATPQMASAQEAPDTWFIKGVVTSASGGTHNMQFAAPDEDQGGRLTVVVFRSKEQCEGARANDPNITGPLAMFAQVVRSRGDSVVVSCEKWQHPPIIKGEQI